ncbi:FlaD/FlaE family flagellar protein, partial [Halodesulfurarchaeum sp.]|uniref:FlaD/FlaE family flagellar protein n=1 Tax=Halodesulfurarchaeum sp. TaxID=1980530 RepID=UPI002FC34589
MDGMDEGGNGATSTEMENRIEDLESEIANVSSTANTVRSENEQISEKVDDVEENVRKLLEIYEMVTRGVNPFVDDVSPEAGMGGGGGSDFGLFGEEEDTAEETEADLGSDIADAEAEGFFEDDAFDDDFEDADEPFESGEEGFDEEFDDDDLGGENLGDEGSEDDGLEDKSGDFAEDESMNGDELLDDDGTAAGEPDEDSTGDTEGGTSFEELKAEYESGDAEWAERDEAPTDPTEEAIESETRTPEPEEETEDLFHQDDLESVNTETEPGVATETDTSTVASETEAEEPLEAATESTERAMDGESADSAMESSQANQADAPKSDSDSGSVTGTATDSGFQFGAATTAETADQPHLTRPPNGYLADVVLMEWLEFLVAEFDARNAIRAINHYERIGWIGEPMRDHCFEVLQGITDGNYPYRDESGPTDLTMNDHRRSLRYIEDLATGHLDRELGDRITSLTTHGVQR